MMGMDRKKTCGDCIHAKICKQVNGGWFSPKNIAYCNAFKDSNKYVEVVRCKDCAVPHNKWLGCPKLRGLVPPPDFYCAFGERREGE